MDDHTTPRGTGQRPARTCALSARTPAPWLLIHSLLDSSTPCRQETVEKARPNGRDSVLEVLGADVRQEFLELLDHFLGLLALFALFAHFGIADNRRSRSPPRRSECRCGPRGRLRRMGRLENHVGFAVAKQMDLREEGLVVEVAHDDPFHVDRQPPREGHGADRVSSAAACRPRRGPTRSPWPPVRLCRWDRTSPLPHVRAATPWVRWSASRPERR